MGVFRVRNCPSFCLFLFCNPSLYCKYSLNLNAECVNLSVIVKDGYFIVFLYIVRNFAFMSNFGKLRQFFYIFCSFLSHCVRMFFVGVVLTKHSDLLSEFLFALFLLLMLEYLPEYLL